MENNFGKPEHYARLSFIGAQVEQAVPAKRPGHLTLSGESATAVFTGTTNMTREIGVELDQVQSEAYKMVNQIATSWNNHLAAQGSELFKLAGESDSEQQQKNQEHILKKLRIGRQQTEFAAQAVVAASNPQEYILSAESAHRISKRNSQIEATDVIQRGFFDRTLINMLRNKMGDLRLTGENFSESVNTGTLTRYAVTFHASAQRQESAVEAAYPTLLLPIDQLGIHITTRVNTSIRNAFHDINGSEFNLARENVLNALVNPEDFYATQTKVIPVYISANAENAAHFVDPKLATPKKVNYDRVPHEKLSAAEIAANQYTTNYLKIGEPHNIIGLAQPTQALNGGQRNFTDTINPAVCIDSILLAQYDPAAPNDLTKAETFSFDTAELSSSYAVEAYSGDSRDVQFNFYAQHISLSPKSAFVYDPVTGTFGAAKTANGNAGARLKTVILANPADVSTHLRLEFSVSINGRLSLSTGLTTLTSTKVQLTGVSSMDVKNPRRFNDGSPEYIKAQQWLNTAKIEGFVLDATFENLNAREYGSRIDSVDMRHYVETSMHPPITAVGPVATNQQETLQQDRFAGLQFQAFALQSGRGIEHIQKHMTRLDAEYRGETRLEMRPVTTLGVASYNVNTFYRSESIDVAQMVAADETVTLVENMRALITNILIRWAAELETESRLQIWRDANYGGQAPAPTILFIYDPILNPYLFTPGDTRLLGDRYPFLTYQTYNRSMRGKLRMLLVDPANNNGGPNQLSHGNTLSKAEVVMKLPVWRQGGTHMELGLAQCFRHIGHLPLGCELNILNVDKLLTSRAYRAVTVLGEVKTTP